MSRNVSESLKKRIAGKQFFKCSNEPNSKIKGLENYFCPLWTSSKNKGSFDESGYDIDHINEHSISKNDSEKNLQALCKSCHMVKTKRFMNKIQKNKKSQYVSDSDTSDSDTNDSDSSDSDSSDSDEQIIKTEDKNIKTFFKKLTSKQIQHICRLMKVNWGGSKHKMINRILSYNVISLVELKKQIDEYSNKKYIYRCGYGHLIYSNKDFKEQFKKLICETAANSVRAYCNECKGDTRFYKFDNPFHNDV